MKTTLPIALALCLFTSSAHAALHLPDGWVAGAPAAASDDAEDPACCTLGRFHPCCGGQRSIQQSRPHQVDVLQEIEIGKLHTVKLEGCAEHVPKIDALPEANRDPAAFGLGVHVENGRKLPVARISEDVRLLPVGQVGGIRVDNASTWGFGSTGTFSDLRSFHDYGVVYDFGVPNKRVGRLIFNTILDDDGGRRYRYFDGSYDIISGQVGKRCFYEVPLLPLIDHWMYGFVGDHDGKLELNVIMPEGTPVLSAAMRRDTAFAPLFAHVVLPLNATTSVATRANSFGWNHVARAIPDVHFLGVLSVHVTQTSTGPVVLVAKERTRNGR